MVGDGVLDYEKVVGKGEKDYGFGEGGVIVKGRVSGGIGGGMWEVWSTVYKGGVLRGVDIIEGGND
ncbi:VanW family protein, partial [Paenibacillus xylanexedens]|uniref:VanW family protein n=1 Tax=Paenibacillus xylanexedens TaxID=528191 RepID=UPI001642D052